MLAYYLERYMRSHLAPLLYQDYDPEGAEERRSSPVAKAVVSESTEMIPMQALPMAIQKRVFGLLGVDMD